MHLQNIGGSGYCKVKKRKATEIILPLDQKLLSTNIYLPNIFNKLYNYYSTDDIVLIVQVKPHTNMVKYFFSYREVDLLRLYACPIL